MAMLAFNQRWLLIGSSDYLEATLGKQLAVGKRSTWSWSWRWWAVWWFSGLGTVQCFMLLVTLFIFRTMIILFLMAMILLMVPAPPQMSISGPRTRPGEGGVVTCHNVSIIISNLNNMVIMVVVWHNASMINIIIRCVSFSICQCHPHHLSSSSPSSPSTPSIAPPPSSWS